MQLIIIISIFNWLNPIPEKFKELICEYELENISIEVSKKGLIKGFSKIDKLSCAEELSISSFWFSIIRNGKSAQTEIIKYENRGTIPTLLKGLEKGDLINFTMTCNPKDYLERRDKIIKVK